MALRIKCGQQRPPSKDIHPASHVERGMQREQSHHCNPETLLSSVAPANEEPGEDLWVCEPVCVHERVYFYNCKGEEEWAALKIAIYLHLPCGHTRSGQQDAG